MPVWEYYCCVKVIYGTLRENIVRELLYRNRSQPPSEDTPGDGETAMPAGGPTCL